MSSNHEEESTHQKLRWRSAGGAWRTVPHDITDGRFRTRQLAGGDYEFQLQAIRKRMTSPFGPSSMLRVSGL